MELSPVEPVGETSWYRDLDAGRKAIFGLYRYAACMKIGWHFKNLLPRGLLVFAFRQENDSDAYRYLHHKIIEESQHTLMFQEFVNPSGLPVRGMSRPHRFLAERIAEPIAKHDPELFFVFVLGGEEPADFLQRLLLREGLRHPLLERVMRIHVTEEARHLSFARHFLTREVPALGRLDRGLLAVVAPIVLAVMERMTLRAPANLRRNLDMPHSVARQAHRRES